MKLVKRRGSTKTKAKLSIADITRLRKSYLLQIKGMVEVPKIPSRLVINWDQAGVQLVPSSNWTLEQQGAKRVELAGRNDVKSPSQLQVHFQENFQQILYQGKTERCHPSQTFPEHNMSLKKMSTQDQVALVIFDVFKGHMCDSMQSLLESNKILQVHVPNNCTDLLPPMDLSVNKPFN